MIIAVQGCCHGDLDNIYATLLHTEETSGIKVDVLIVGGDFEAIRNEHDVSALAVPDKYLHAGDFYKYYSGEKVAPCLTIFIGGNHEASNYLWSLYYGGWVAPNIYFLGHSGCVRFGLSYGASIRIAGLSGIFKTHDYKKGYFEQPPYTEDTKRSIYHVREYEVEKLRALSSPVHVFISHDWPRGIWEYGTKSALLQRKPDFERDFINGTFGNPHTMTLLEKLQPTYWFAAHHHVKFAAIVPHYKNDATEGTDGPQSCSQQSHSTTEYSMMSSPTSTMNESLFGSPTQSPSQGHFGSSPQPRALSHTFPAEHPRQFPQGQRPVSSSPTNQPPTNVTRFLALDKCLPGRRYFQVLDVSTEFRDELTERECTTTTCTTTTAVDSPSAAKIATTQQPGNSTNTTNSKFKLFYDLEWLSILQASHKHFPTSRKPSHQPSTMNKMKAELSDKDYLRNVQQCIGESGKFGNLAAGDFRGLEVPTDFVQTVAPYDPNKNINFKRLSQATAPTDSTDNPQTRRFLQQLCITENWIANPVKSPSTSEGITKSDSLEVPQVPNWLQQQQQHRVSDTEPAGEVDDDCFFIDTTGATT